MRQAHKCIEESAKILGDRATAIRSHSIDLENALSFARGQLVDALTAGRIAESDIEDACWVLVRIEELQEQFAADVAAHRTADFAAVHNAAVGLRQLPSRDIIQSAPAAVCTALSFARSLISAVNGSLWQPRRLYVTPELDGSIMDFSDYIHSTQFSLSQAPLETELVRRKIPALVPAPADDDRTLKELVSAAQTPGYVAAPVMSRGRVIGMLHADRTGTASSVDPDDRDRLDAFATFLGVVWEHAVLRERLSLQRSRVEASFDATESMLTRLQKADVTLRSPVETPAEHINTAADEIETVELTAVLTFREREILSHMATGATNTQIAQRLVISDGTVKSHVKHILKKLGTPTRAAAAVLYASQIHR
ncbi:LuxR C-terminal-related transcriptional regulator (plasmid) [Rhodococcus opacus]|uniref:helix-turn-helix transcriptional regulator n=1 Tax=Rhodococcus opacus TaxID=37919 RepID=UPI0034D35344